MEKSYEKRLEEAAIDGVLYNLQPKFKITELMQYLETCKDIPEAVFDSKKVQKRALDYLILILDHGENSEQIVTTAKLLKLLKVPEIRVTATVVRYLRRAVRKELPYFLVDIVKTFSIPVSALDRNKMVKLINATIRFGGFNKETVKDWLFFADYFPLDMEIKREIFGRIIGRYVDLDRDALPSFGWGEEYLDQLIKSLDISRAETGWIALNAIVRKLGEGYPGVNADSVLRLLHKFETSWMLHIDDAGIKKVVIGVTEMFIYDNVDGAAKIIARFQLTKEDFDKDKILEGADLDTITGDSTDSVYLTEFLGLTKEDKTRAVRKSLPNSVRYQGAGEVFALVDKYGIPRSEVINEAKRAVIIDLNSYNPDDAVKLIDQYGLSWEFLAIPQVTASAEKALVWAYSNADTAKIKLLKDKFKI